MACRCLVEPTRHNTLTTSTAARQASLRAVSTLAASRDEPVASITARGPSVDERCSNTHLSAGPRGPSRAVDHVQVRRATKAAGHERPCHLEDLPDLRRHRGRKLDDDPLGHRRAVSGHTRSVRLPVGISLQSGAVERRLRGSSGLTAPSGRAHRSGRPQGARWLNRPASLVLHRLEVVWLQRSNFLMI